MFAIECLKFFLSPSQRVESHFGINWAELPLWLNSKVVRIYKTRSSCYVSSACWTSHLSVNHPKDFFPHFVPLIEFPRTQWANYLVSSPPATVSQSKLQQPSQIPPPQPKVLLTPQTTDTILAPKTLRCTNSPMHAFHPKKDENCRSQSSSRNVGHRTNLEAGRELTHLHSWGRVLMKWRFWISSIDLTRRVR